MFENVSLNELFPTPLFVADLAAPQREALAGKLTPRLDAMLEGARTLKPGEGWSTPADMHKDPAFADLATVIMSAGKAAVDALNMTAEGLFITGCWANISPPGASNGVHNHPNNYLSGVYYLKTARDADRIVFRDPRPQAETMMPPASPHTKFTGNTVSLEAKEGRMVIFPAWLGHEVPVNRSNANRISIAFNLMFERFAERMAAPQWTPNLG